MSADDSAPERATGLSRRGFLGATGAVAAAGAVLGSGPAEAAPRASHAQERSMILRIADAGSVFPISLPPYNQPGPEPLRKTIASLRAARRRFRGSGVAMGERRPATRSRLLAAERGLPVERRAAARRGADLLIARGRLDSGRAALIQCVGELWTSGAQNERDDLLAAVTLAVATSFPGSNAQFEATARDWVGLLGTMHRHGTLAGALRHRGIG